MSEAQRRYMHARQRVEAELVTPVTELLNATTALVNDESKRAETAERALQELRPVWAQGWSDDSMAAQASANALAEIWQLLGVTDQTEAMQRLRDLIAVGKTAPANIWAERAAGTWHPGDDA